jgi:DNA-binding transcriptional LysR family regulator
MDDLRALRYFVALCDHGHFGRAASHLGISQPALSERLKRLEEWCETALIVRSSRRFELTAAGQTLLGEARRLIAEADALGPRVRRGGEGPIATVRCALVASGAFAIIPRLVRSFTALHPNIKLELREGPFEVPFEELDKGLIDVVITRGPLHNPDFQIESLTREALCVALPKGHRLASKRVVQLSSLADEPFVMFPRSRSPEFFDAIVGLCQSEGFSPRIANEAVEWQMIVSLVAAGLGVTLAPMSVREMPRAGVAFLEVTPRTRVAELVTVCRRGAASPQVQALLDVASRSAKPAANGFRRAKGRVGY